MRFYSVYNALFTILLIAYTQWVHDDLASKILLALTLIFISCCLSRPTINASSLHYNNTLYLIYQSFILLLTISDISLKLYLKISNITKYQWLINPQVANQILAFKLQNQAIAYLLMILCSILAIYNCPRYTPIKNLVDEKISIQVMTEAGKYIILGLLYALAFMDSGPRKYYWIILCAIYILKQKSSVLLRIVSFGVIFEIWMSYVSTDKNWGDVTLLFQKYQPRYRYMNQIFLAIQIVLIFFLQRQLFWVINKKQFDDQEQRVTEQRQRRMSFKRRKTIQQYEPIMSLITIFILTLLLLLTNTTPGNIIFILTFYYHLPVCSYNVFTFLQIGAVVSLIFKPSNFLFLIYILVLKFFKSKLFVITLPQFPLKIPILFVRLAILFSKINIVNIVSAAVPTKWMQILILSVRILCRVFHYKNEAIGVGDSFQRTNWLLDNSLTDSLYYIYFLLLIFNDPNKPQVSETVWKKVEIVFHVFRYFHWIAYTVIAGMVLTSEQSLFQIFSFSLLLALLVTELLVKERHTKLRMQKILWFLYLIQEVMTIAANYIYMFSKYDKISQYFIKVAEYEKFIGLYDRNSDPRTIFIIDLIQISISLISLYILSIKTKHLDYTRPSSQLQEQLIVDQKMEQVSRIYNTYIKSGVALSEGSRLTQFKNFVAGISIDLNFIVMMFFHIYWEQNPYYLAYLVFLMFYYLQSYYLPENYHALYQDTHLFLKGRDSYQVNQTAVLQLKCRQTFEKMQSYKTPTLYLTIIYSAGLIIWNYSILLWNTFIKGDYDNRYQFIKMLPQISIFIVNIIAILFHSEQTYEVPPPMDPEKVWQYKNNQSNFIDVLEIIIITYIGSESIQKVGFLWIFIVAFAVRRMLKYLELRNEFNILFIGMALMGVYWGNILWLFPLFGFRFYLYQKWKFCEVISNSHMIEPESSVKESYEIKINIISQLVVAFSIPFLCNDLEFIKLPLFIFLIAYLFERNFLFVKNYKIHYYFLFVVRCVLYVIVIVQGFFREINRFDSFIYFVIGSLIEIGFYMIKEGEVLESTKKGNELLLEKSGLICYILSYLQNELKLQKLKIFYRQRKELEKNVEKVRKQIDTIRDNPTLSLHSLTLLEPQQTEQQMLLKTYKALYQFNKSQLLNIFWKFHYYLKGKSNIDPIEQIYEFQQKVMDRNKESLFEAINEERTAMGLTSFLEESEVTSVERIQVYNKYLNDLIGQFMTTKQSRVSFLRLLLDTFITYIDQVSLIMLALWGVFGGAYTMPINIVAFGWGMVIQGKPKARFWNFCFLYIVGVLLIKWFIPFVSEMIIIKIVFTNSAHSSFYEGVLLVVLAIEITLTKISGLKDKTSVSIQDVNQSMLRYTLTRASFGVQNYQQQRIFIQCYKNWDQQQKRNSFFFRRFSKLNFKAGADYYPFICTAQVFITIYIFLFYDSIELEQKKNTASLALTYNQFSKHMIIVLFIQVMIMIADRCITTLNYYDSAETKQLNFILSFLFKVYAKKQANPGNFKSQYDLPLVLKYVLHLIVLISVNVLVLIYFPSTQNFNKQNQSYFYLSGFFCLFQFYFLFNALQIKHGFTRLKGKNILMTSFHYVNLYLYKIYSAIPFLSQFKKICDWSLTTTALPLFHWLKFQDMYSRLYTSKCETEMLKRKPYGSQMWWMKYVIAPLGFLSIIALVFGPMGIYSDINPFAVEDQIIGAEMIINLKVNNNLNFKMYSNSHVTKINKLNTSDYQINGKYSLFQIELDKYPDKNLLYSEPVLTSIMQMINNTLNKKENNTFALEMAVVIAEKQGGKVKTSWTTYSLAEFQYPSLYSLLQTNNSFTIPLFYSPFPDHLPNKSMTFRARTNNWEVFSNQDQTTTFYLITLPKFQMQFSATYIYITYVFLISRLMKIYLLATVENAVFEGAEVERVLYLCSAVISARRLENTYQEEYLYFELIDLIREPEKMKANTGSLLEFRQKRC